VGAPEDWVLSQQVDVQGCATGLCSRFGLTMGVVRARRHLLSDSGCVHSQQPRCTVAEHNSTTECGLLHLFVFIRHRQCLYVVHVVEVRVALWRG
jgi:hypothetical protein